MMIVNVCSITNCWSCANTSRRRWQPRDDVLPGGLVCKITIRRAAAVVYNLNIRCPVVLAGEMNSIKNSVVASGCYVYMGCVSHNMASNKNFVII